MSRIDTAAFTHSEEDIRHRLLCACPAPGRGLMAMTIAAEAKLGELLTREAIAHLDGLVDARLIMRRTISNAAGNSITVYELTPAGSALADAMRATLHRERQLAGRVRRRYERRLARA